VYTKQQRIAALAKRSPQMAFTSLAYLMDLEWLREAYRRTRKDAAPGVDGQTAAEYSRALEANLAALLERAKSGTYWAPPVRRVHIPKGSSGTETRPIGVPTFEDKVLQRAVVMLLEPIWEQDFLACSYGFRPRRSAHDALEALWKRSMDQQGGWVVEVDIRRFFDTVVHGHLRRFLQQRVRDGVLRRLIDKWLKAGVLEGGELHYPEDGTPQGGVISPLAANVYLHEVLDRWFEEEIKPRLRGSAFLIRYADDAVLGFAHRADAERVMAVLPKRFARYGLQLHPEKTRLVAFQPPAPVGAPAASAAPAPGTFSFLGFCHYWRRSRQGNWVVARKTAPDRFTRALHKIAQWCKQHRHDPLPVLQRGLAIRLRGHDTYFGITGNSVRVSAFHYWVRWLWRRWLDRRGSPGRLNWERFARLLERYPLPGPRVVHSVCRVANP
jgi:group II intron reverse transcriptase/maturase